MVRTGSLGTFGVHRLATTATGVLSFVSITYNAFVLCGREQGMCESVPTPQKPVTDMASIGCWLAAKHTIGHSQGGSVQRAKHHNQPHWFAHLVPLLAFAAGSTVALQVCQQSVLSWVGLNPHWCWRRWDAEDQEACLQHLVTVRTLPVVVSSCLLHVSGFDGQGLPLAR